jgi:site-specific recombinase XerD
LELPKEEHRLPANYLSEIEVELLLNQTDVKTPLGIRDRAILETLYSSAIRRNELLNLSIYDVDRNRRLLTIRQGKGKRDRVVPIGVRALEWLEKYIVDVRPWLMEGHGRRRGIKEVEPTTKIILHNTGAEMHPTNLPILVRGYLNAAGITAVMDAAAEDGRNPHPLPFSLAAREKGAEGGLRDVSFIQEIRSEHEWLLEAGVEILGCLCHWIAWG